SLPWARLDPPWPGLGLARCGAALPRRKLPPSAAPPIRRGCAPLPPGPECPAPLEFPAPPAMPLRSPVAPLPSPRRRRLSARPPFHTAHAPLQTGVGERLPKDETATPGPGKETRRAVDRFHSPEK